MEKVYQEPLYAYQMYPNSSKLYYAYACNGCGVEVKGYYQKRIKGHTWCYKCNRKNETERQRNKKIESENKKLQDFAQWLWDNHYLTQEAFTVNLVEQFKERG